MGKNDSYLFNASWIVYKSTSKHFELTCLLLLWQWVWLFQDESGWFPDMSDKREQSSIKDSLMRSWAHRVTSSSKFNSIATKKILSKAFRSILMLFKIRIILSLNYGLFCLCLLLLNPVVTPGTKLWMILFLSKSADSDQF